MNKKNNLFIFIMLVLCMFIGVNRVDAATGLYCIYDNGDLRLWDYIMLVQDNNGDVSVYNIKNNMAVLLSHSTVSYDSFAWTKYESVYNFVDVFSDKFDANGDLVGCPGYFRSGSGEFTDTKDALKDENDLLSNKSGSFNDPNLSSDDFIVATFADSSSYIVNGSNYNSNNYRDQWLVEPIYGQSCLYSYKSSDDEFGSIQLDIDYSSRKIRLSSVYSASGNFIIKNTFKTDYNFSYLERYFSNSCPYDLYGFSNFDESTYFSYNANVFSENRFSLGGRDFVTTVQRYDLSNSDPKVGDMSIAINPNVITVDNCEDLLGEELTGLLHGVVNVIKILVPIILIILGIVDFTQATFGSKEDDMKKATSKFIKRVVIAVVIFFIPSFLNILLSIANSIWGNIDPSLCGIL